MPYKAPMVSVVMPAFNAEQHLENAVNSVLTQTYRNLELIVVDDGSTDHTLSILKAISIHDSRLKIISQNNSGRPSIARNRGISIASGEYISFLDSDDLWEPSRVEKMVTGLDGHPEWVAAFHDLKLVDEFGARLGKTYLADVSFLTNASQWMKKVDNNWFNLNSRFYVYMSLYYAAAHTQSILIARSRLPAEILNFNQNYIICEDTDLWIRVAMSGRLGFLNEVLSSYRQLNTSITRNKVLFANQSAEFHKANYQRLSPHLSKEEIIIYKKKIANYIRNLAFLKYDEYNLQEARKAYLEAFLLDINMKDVISFTKTLLPEKILKLARQASNKQNRLKNTL